MKSPWAFMIGAALLAGCGIQPTPTTPERDRPEPRPSARPSHPAAPGMPGMMPPGVAPMPGMPGAGDPFELLDRSRAAFEAMPGYACEMSFTQKGPTKTSHGTYAVEGKQPRSLKLEVKAGGTAGAKIRWDGGSTCKLRAPGVLGAIAIDLPINHDRLISVRGYTLKDTDIVALYTMITSRKNQVQALGPTNQGPAFALTGPGLLKDIKRMVVVLDPQSLLLKSFEMSDGKEVVYKMQIKNIRAKKNVNLDL